MIIIIHRDGSVAWHFYRKSYRKARWRRAGQRRVNDIQKDGAFGMAVII